jgi:dihydroneopterin aldolase
MPDSIFIKKLELFAHLGVTPAERQRAQRIAVSLNLEPEREFVALNDELRNTVDYFEVSEAVKRLVLSQACSLVETLAEKIATWLLESFALRAVEVEVFKFVIPNTESVSVKIRREKQG